MDRYTTTGDIVLLRSYFSAEIDPQAVAALDRIARREAQGPGTWMHRCGAHFTGNAKPTGECATCFAPGHWNRLYR